MFWFKNAQIYRLTKEIDFSNIEQTLQRYKFTECQASDVSKLGWANPLNYANHWVHSPLHPFHLIKHLVKS